jgi:hypothetical protein
MLRDDGSPSVQACPAPTRGDPRRARRTLPPRRPRPPAPAANHYDVLGVPVDASDDDLRVRGAEQRLGAPSALRVARAGQTPPVSRADADAAPRPPQAAFRRKAKELHPDVNQQVTGPQLAGRGCRGSRRAQRRRGQGCPRPVPTRPPLPSQPLETNSPAPARSSWR